MSWDAERASKLATSIEGLQIEPHPVSGELELEDIKTIQYRRLDEETLQTRLEVEEFELLPVYVWCESDEHGGGGRGWRLAELRALDDREDGTEWFDTMSEANEANQRSAPVSLPHAEANGHSSIAQNAENGDGDGDDDDYWASYDRTPGQTPARTPARTPAKHSPAPNTGRWPSNNQESSAEQDYYARYGSEVQPALDNHDPDEEHEDAGGSTLTGDALLQQQRAQLDDQTESSLPPPYAKTLLPLSTHDSAIDQSIHSEVSAPRPTSPSSQGSVERLEQSAADMTRAEVGVKQFVSTEIKSLFRLARSVGIDRGEFDRIIKTELDVLGMFEVDD